MRKFFAFISVMAFAALTLQAQVRDDAVNTLLNTTYGAIAAQSASNTVAVLDQSKQGSMALQFTFKNDATASDNLTLVFYPSLDGVKWGGTGSSIITALTTGGVEKTIVTNLPSVVGVRYWKLGYITNAAATSIVTNYSLTYSIKTGL